MDDLVPSEFYLGQNFPNPFIDKTTIKYCVAYKTKVKITIYNSEGKIIKVLVNEIKEAGTYEVEFTAAEEIDESFKGETYFCRFEAGSFSNTKTMELSKNLIKEA